MADKPLVNALVNSVQRAELDAYNRLTPRRPKQWRGTEAYFQTLEHLGLELLREPLNFTEENIFNQRRFLSPEGRYPYRVRFLNARGKVAQQQVRMNPRGKRTRFLIEKENANFMGQLELFGPPPVRNYQNIWIVTSVDKANMVSIHLAFPYNLSDDGRELDCLACEPLDLFDLLATASLYTERPESVATDFPEIRERDYEEDDDNEEQDMGELGNGSTG